MLLVHQITTILKYQPAFQSEPIKIDIGKLEFYQFQIDFRDGICGLICQIRLRNFSAVYG